MDVFPTAPEAARVPEKTPTPEPGPELMVRLTCRAMPVRSPLVGVLKKVLVVASSRSVATVPMIRRSAPLVVGEGIESGEVPLVDWPLTTASKGSPLVSHPCTEMTTAVQVPAPGSTVGLASAPEAARFQNLKQ